MAQEVDFATAPASSSASPAVAASPLAGYAGGVLAGLGLIKPTRRIGAIMATITIDESVTDELEITQHPVETGAAITDHAFKKPPVVMLRLGWSDSGWQPGYSLQAYNALLALQYSRIPFVVVTGKRTLVNMLIRGIVQTTDSHSENGLALALTCQQIIIVTTQTTSVAAKPADQAQPAATQGTTTTGEQQPQTRTLQPSIMATAARAAGEGNLVTEGPNTLALHNTPATH